MAFDSYPMIPTLRLPSFFRPSLLRDPEAWARKLEERLRKEQAGKENSDVHIFKTSDGMFLRFSLQTGKFVGVKEQVRADSEGESKSQPTDYEL